MTQVRTDSAQKERGIDEPKMEEIHYLYKTFNQMRVRASVNNPRHLVAQKAWIHETSLVTYVPGRNPRLNPKIPSVLLLHCSSPGGFCYFSFFSLEDQQYP